MSDACGDNRFEIIEAYKKKLIEDTNIESRPDEMAVIDNILLRFWQMGWLSSAQPTQTNTSNTLKSLDCVDRQAVIDLWDKYHPYISIKAMAYDRELRSLLSAQPEERALHESCTDCPLYDHDRHSCPRFNKVIPETLREVQSEQRWIPCSKKLPEPNRSVLAQLSDDFVDPIQIMTLNISKCEGDFFWSWRTQEMGIDFDMDDVVAWMPLPKSYSERKQDGAV